MSGQRYRLRDVITGIANELRSTGHFHQVQTVDGTDGMDRMGESIPESPLAQVYLERCAPATSTTNRTSFAGRAGSSTVYTRRLTIHVDVYARTRSSIGEDLLAVYDAHDVVEELLADQERRPYLQTPAAAFNWRSERLTFEYADSKYAGLRFVLELTIT